MTMVQQAGISSFANPPVPATINDLNGDSLAYLFSFLNLEDFPTLPQVCTQWSKLVSENVNVKHHVESLLPDRIKALPLASLKEKTKVYLKELESQVSFVLNNPNLKIHVYLWSPEAGDPLFHDSLIRELQSDQTLSWKAKRISEAVNSATFFNQPEKIACHKFTYLASGKDIEEANQLLAAGFDPNSSLSEEQAGKYPTALFTLVDVGIGFGGVTSVEIVRLIQNMIDHGLDITIQNNKGRIALDLLERNPNFSGEIVPALKKYAESKRPPLAMLD